MRAEELTSNKIYDKLASTYGLEVDVVYTQFLKYHLLERFAERKHVCLDIGIANGILSIPLSNQVREIHGIDISPKMLEECSRKLNSAGIKNVYLYNRTASSLLFQNDFFDMVYSFSTLLLVKDIEHALREIVRVLREGGLAILDITGKYNLSQTYWRKYYKNNGHWGLHSFALKEIESKFRNLGMIIIERHATGLLDQWKYIFGLNWVGKFCLDKLFHCTPRAPDLDYRISQRFPHLANRWYFVLRKWEDASGSLYLNSTS